MRRNCCLARPTVRVRLKEGASEQSDRDDGDSEVSSAAVFRQDRYVLLEAHKDRA
jgi:hypothetical protein